MAKINIKSKKKFQIPINKYLIGIWNLSRNYRDWNLILRTVNRPVRPHLN